MYYGVFLDINFVVYYIVIQVRFLCEIIKSVVFEQFGYLVVDFWSWCEQKISYVIKKIKFCEEE